MNYTYYDDGQMQTATRGSAATTYTYLPGGYLDTTSLPNGAFDPIWNWFGNATSFRSVLGYALGQKS